MNTLFKRTVWTVSMAAVGLGVAGCADLAGGLFLTAASLRTLHVSVTDAAGHPVRDARVTLYQKVPDRIHGGDNEVRAVGPLVTDEKGIVLARLAHCSPVVARVTLPDGREARLEQPWPKSGAELHLTIEGPKNLPIPRPEAPTG